MITLVAFVWLFTTVRFQMSPQIACLRRFILTLVALFWLHVLTILCHILRSFFVDTLKFFIHNLWEEMGDTWPPRFALITDILWILFTQQKKRESVLSVFLNTKKRGSPCTVERGGVFITSYKQLAKTFSNVMLYNNCYPSHFFWKKSDSRGECFVKLLDVNRLLLLLLHPIVC